MPKISVSQTCMSLIFLSAGFVWGQVTGGSPAESANGSSLVTPPGCARSDCVTEWVRKAESFERPGPAQSFENAAVYFHRAADIGDPRAQTEIGRLYLFGLGVMQNRAEAFRWMQRAAVSGYAPSQDALGLMYLYGVGTPQNDESAAFWFRAAAEQGYAPAQVNLGMLYRAGRGLQRDFRSAVQWFRRAEKHRLAEAEYGLGLSYERGEGVRQDAAESVKWYDKAAKRGFGTAELNLGLLLRSETAPVKDYPRALSLLTRAADKGFPSAAVVAGLMYLGGVGTPINKETGGMWLIIAKLQGFTLPSSTDQELLKLNPDELERAQARAEQWMKKLPASDLKALSQSVGITESLK